MHPRIVGIGAGGRLPPRVVLVIEEKPGVAVVRLRRQTAEDLPALSGGMREERHVIHRVGVLSVPPQLDPPVWLQLNRSNRTHPRLPIAETIKADLISHCITGQQPYSHGDGVAQAFVGHTHQFLVDDGHRQQSSCGFPLGRHLDTQQIQTRRDQVPTIVETVPGDLLG